MCVDDTMVNFLRLNCLRVSLYSITLHKYLIFKQSRISPFLFLLSSLCVGSDCIWPFWFPWHLYWHKSKHPEKVACVYRSFRFEPCRFSTDLIFLLILIITKLNTSMYWMRFKRVNSTYNMHYSTSYPTQIHYVPETLPIPLGRHVLPSMKEYLLPVSNSVFSHMILIFWVNYCNLHYPSLKLTGLMFQKDVKFLTSVHEDLRMKNMNQEILHQYRHRCPLSILPFIYTWLDILKVYGYLYLPIHDWFKQKIQSFITSTWICTHV